jgi:hypothetical protein
MSYKFKVGDKGKTASGVGYEVVVHVASLSPAYRIYAKVQGQSMLIPYYENGTRPSIHGECGNLLPPSRTVFVNLYRGGYAYWYAGEKEASGAPPHSLVGSAVPVIIPQEV